MNRLRDYSGSGPVSERGIDMLRGTPATPANADLKSRVWGALERTPVDPVGGLRMPGVKVLALGVTIISLAGTAGAVITGRWIVPALDRARGNDRASAPAVRGERKRAVRRIATAPASVPVHGDEEVAAVPAPAPTPVRPAQPSRVRARPATVSAAAVSASTTQERTQVLDALIALRRDHDPVRAGTLLDRYLTAHPRGALREEALVLATEAADARGDHALAQRLARAYQADYPNGRFRQFARSHIPSAAAPGATEPSSDP
jgi:hypothetical protein